MQLAENFEVDVRIIKDTIYKYKTASKNGGIPRLRHLNIFSLVFSFWLSQKVVSLINLHYF